MSSFVSKNNIGCALHAIWMDVKGNVAKSLMTAWTPRKVIISASNCDGWRTIDLFIERESEYKSWLLPGEGAPSTPTNDQFKPRNDLKITVMNIETWSIHGINVKNPMANIWHLKNKKKSLKITCFLYRKSSHHNSYTNISTTDIEMHTSVKHSDIDYVFKQNNVFNVLFVPEYIESPNQLSERPQTAIHLVSASQ